MGKMFDLIKEGLKDAIAYEKGKIELRTKEIHIPSPPKEYRASDVKNLNLYKRCQNPLLKRGVDFKETRMKAFFARYWFKSQA